MQQERVTTREVQEHGRDTIDILERLAADLSAFEADRDSMGEDEAFARLVVQSQGILGRSDATMASSLRVSRPTFSRWRRRVSAPHPNGRHSAIALLIQEVSALLKVHRSILEEAV